MRERVTEKEEREEETWACLGRGWGDSEGKTRGRWTEAKRGGESHFVWTWKLHSLKSLAAWTALYSRLIHLLTEMVVLLVCLQ